MKLMSKWNWRNFYGLEKGKAPIEVVKEGGSYYLAKYIIGKWLTAIGNPLKNFTLISK